LPLNVGFYNAPVTKLLVVSIGALSTLGAILKLKPYYHIQLIPHITIYHQVNEDEKKRKEQFAPTDFCAYSL
jgi:hypothetical protein